MTVYAIGSTEWVRKSSIDGRNNCGIQNKVEQAAEVRVKDIISRYGYESSPPHRDNVVVEEVSSVDDIQRRGRIRQKRIVTFSGQNVEYELVGGNADVDGDDVIVEENAEYGIIDERLNQGEAVRHIYRNTKRTEGISSPENELDAQEQSDKYVR